MKEKNIVQKIRLAIGKLRDVRLFVNTSAHAWVGVVEDWDKKAGVVVLKVAHPITAGLQFGSSDLIGLRKCPHGCGCAQFVSIEVKKPEGELSEGQRDWLNMVHELGGLAAVVTSPEEVKAVLEAQ